MTLIAWLSQAPYGFKTPMGCLMTLIAWFIRTKCDASPDSTDPSADGGKVFYPNIQRLHTISVSQEYVLFELLNGTDFTWLKLQNKKHTM